jgi:Flp pilus assembly protein TadG
MKRYLQNFWQNFWSKQEGTAAMEAAMLFPILITLLMGVYDLGNGIILSQKTITATQIAADLLARDQSVNNNELDNSIEAARLAFQPYRLNEFGIDIVSIRFDQNRMPQILWRETRDMPANNEAVTNTNGIGDMGEGMMIVTVRYTYKPYFVKFFTSDIEMQEVAYSRGRRSPTVTRD